ncbi:MAG: rhomboid family intramembrane serine protease [Candidatus Ancillula sp.]|jgi:membrane associated rhomboid family serine protease|nr:rhomboid family intramembrane serine protease [Candidatus Ancillula sp.]
MPYTKQLQNWIRNYPATFTLIAICVLVWLAEIVLGPNFVARGIFAPVVSGAEPWRAVTSVFMHNWTNPLHILFNMIALGFSGPIFEQIFGRVKYVSIFVISGVAGNIFMGLWYWVFGGGYAVVSLGASGAVFGLFGGLMVLHRRLGANAKGIYLTVGINLLMSFYIANLAWQAHVGGLIAGVVTTWVFIKYSTNRFPNA